MRITLNDYATSIGLFLIQRRGIYKVAGFYDKSRAALDYLQDIQRWN